MANETELIALVAKQLVALRWAFRTLAKQVGPKGETGDVGARGDVGPRGPAWPPGEDGRDGQDGADGKDGRDGTDGKDGAKGDTGPAPAHQWRKTKLRFQKPDGTWGDYVDLQGPEGKAGTGGGVRIVGSAEGGFDPSTAPVADTVVAGDEMLLVRGGTLMRVFVTLTGGAEVPTGAVTVNGQYVMVNGEYVVTT